MKPTRESAWKLLNEYNQSESLIQHALQVEAVMRHFSKIFNGDEEEWGVIGLIHDLDYEKYPDEHCEKTKEILENENWPPEYVRAVISHGYGVVNDVEPLTNLEKVLFTIDELTGLINAACIMRPSKSILDFNIKSLNKKFKDKKFAAGCDRDVILKGCEMLDLDKEYVFNETIKGLQEYAEDVGLKGNL